MAAPDPQPRARRGRRPGSPATREAILDAARDRFAGDGYDRATIRSIAADAGVDPSLVMHYFGSKAGLFVAAADWEVSPHDVLAATVDGDPQAAGERLVRRILEAWDQGGDRNPAITVLRGAFGDPRHARLVQDFLEPHLQDLVRALGADEAELRAALLMGQLLGLATARHVLELEALRSASRDRLVAIHAPLVQQILTGALPGSG